MYYARPLSFDASALQVYTARKLLPCPVLHPDLNPYHVQVKRSVRELPLCWYGIELLPKNVLDLAIELGLAVRNEENGRFSWGDTFYALRDDFEAETGVRFELRDVWGASTGPSPIVGFFSNWEVEAVTMRQMGHIEGLLGMMGYPDGYKVRWYPDIDETVGAGVSIRLFVSSFCAHSVEDQLSPPLSSWSSCFVLCSLGSRRFALVLQVTKSR